MGTSSIPGNPDLDDSHHQFHIAGMPPAAIAFLILTAAIELTWSHYQLLWPDEFGVLNIVRIPTITRLIHAQMTAPTMLDPVVYSVTARASVHLFGESAFAMRLPSMCSYLLMQVCLFYFVRRIAGERAATVALALPALMGVVSYSVQARPYGLLLGLSALAILCWQTASRRDSRRTLALVGLALSLALAVNTHYYGVFLFIPLFAAESVRTLWRRRVDIPILASILAGMAGLLAVIPFARGASPFSTYIGAKVADYHFITHSYLWLLLGYEDLSVHIQHLIGLGTALLLICLIAGFVSLRSRVTLRLPPAEATLLLTLGALPFFGYLVGNAASHPMQSRYVLPTMIAIASILAILIAPLLQNKAASRIVLALLFVAIAGAGLLHIRSEDEKAHATMASLVVDPVTQRELAMFPGQPIYVMNPGIFAIIGYYSPSADVRSRITLVYSRVEEMLSRQHTDFLSLTADNMRAAGVRNVVPYGSASEPRTEHLYLLYHGPWDWTDQALAASDAQIAHLGPLFGGDLVLVRFP
jgi:hypothetical protein